MNGPHRHTIWLKRHQNFDRVVSPQNRGQAVWEGVGWVAGWLLILSLQERYHGFKVLCVMIKEKYILGVFIRNASLRHF